MALNAPAWLTARPIAHRGLHCAARGVIENTHAAARAAIAANYAIECDIQAAGDGEAMVFHDFTLERLTAAAGRLDGRAAAELGTIAIRNSGETIAALPAFLGGIAGRTPLVIEIKSRFDGDTRLAERLIVILAGYGGPVAVKSFDPAQLTFIRARGFDRPLGLVAQAGYDASDWPELSTPRRIALQSLQGFAGVRPDFLSWHVGDLPHATPQLCRVGLGLPVMAWTVRSEDDRARAAKWADQIVFEGFAP